MQFNALSLIQLKKIESILGLDSIEIREEIIQKRMENTLDSKRKIVAIVRPSNQSHVIDLVKYFFEQEIPYSPISTGLNWGYGGALPVSNNCVIVDLSRLKKISNFSDSLSSVSLEPGVTQQDFYDFLNKYHHGKFLVPTTGAGPQASIVGNALERGYGITPIEDHFLSVLSIKAVLPDGSIYESALAEAGGTFSDQVFKWKIGPYLDGLFAQSNFATVLEMRIALKQKPENISQFIVFLNDENFESAVEAIRKIRNTLGGVVGGINLMNKRRLLSMLESEWTQNRALEEMRVIELSGKRALSDWVIVGALYGNLDIVKAGLKSVRKNCKHFARKIILLDKKKILLAKKFLAILPARKLRQMIFTAEQALEILEGKPSEMALPLTYLKNAKKPQRDQLNPDLDNCGLFWFAPLVPMDEPTARDFVQEVAKICLSYDMDPLITLTSISERCFDATIPLLYNKDLLGEKERALACLEKLIEVCREMGLFPYRLSVDHMHKMLGDKSVSFQLIKKIKDSIDPKNLLSPGRYSKI